MIRNGIFVKGLILFYLVLFSHLSFSQIIDYIVYEYDSLPLSGKRVALVIGNSSYSDIKLKNVPENVNNMSSELTELGFEVLLAIDVDRKQMLKKIIEYEEKLDQQIEISFIYYIGYGFHYIDNNNNYLLPVKVTIKKPQDIELEAININRIFQTVEKNNTGINVFIFDASYENNYSLQNISSFLMPDTKIPPGSYLLISNTSSTKSQFHNTSFFTDEFINVLKIPGLPMEDLFKQLRINIYNKSNKTQIPWNTQSVDGLFYLNRK